MRSRREPLEHVLVAGDVSELGSVRALLALLPRGAYGQVYVETDADRATLPDLCAPPRVTVTVLPRRDTDAPGERLGAAVEGWLGEWIPEEPDDRRAVTMWVGQSVGSRISTSALCLERL